MLKKPIVRNIVLIWLGWFVVLYGFQWLISERLDLVRPDYAVPWTATETLEDSNKGKIYLLEPFLNRQVAWDSEYYLGIAVGGYDDPNAGVAVPADGQEHIKNYSFFPLYPYVMRIFAFPLALLGLNAIATAALAGVIVSLLGTLAGMLALYDLTRDFLDENDTLRMVFYMLVFPTSFFFAMIYTEGLFAGLAFWSLALMRRRQLIWAGVLAALAAWTRAHGAALALPLVIAWLLQFDWKKPGISFKMLVQGLGVFLPLAAYLIWRYSPLGEGWAVLQPGYFGRGLFSIGGTLGSLNWMLDHAENFTEARLYLAIEAVSVLIAFISALALVRKMPEVAAFSLVVVILSVFSGSTQSLARYMIVTPAMYIVLAKLGRNKAFDTTWTLLSILLLGMQALLFSFDMWVG